MFTLIDGVARNTEHPDTFEIPSEEERRAVKAGDLVKLGFLMEDEEIAGERMWVEITTVDPELTGTLANFPIVLKMEWGDEVSFGFDNILSITNWEEE